MLTFVRIGIPGKPESVACASAAGYVLAPNRGLTQFCMWARDRCLERFSSPNGGYDPHRARGHMPVTRDYAEARHKAKKSWTARRRSHRGNKAWARYLLCRHNCRSRLTEWILRLSLIRRCNCEEPDPTAQDATGLRSHVLSREAFPQRFGHAAILSSTPCCYFTYYRQDSFGRSTAVQPASKIWFKLALEWTAGHRPPLCVSEL